MLGSRFVWWVSLLLVLSFVGLSHARVIIIPDDEETIQAGIDEAEDGDVVLVLPGIYYENINFEGKAITVGSLILTTGNEAYIDSTVIDGNRNRRSVVVFRNGEDESSILTGFSIQNGETDYGGGIYIRESSPLLSYLTVKDNYSERSGGGIYCTTASPIIRNTTITGNSTGTDGDIIGGGIGCYNHSNPRITSSVITHNSAVWGGGIACGNESMPVMKNLIIQFNIGEHGSAISSSYGSRPNISNSYIAFNGDENSNSAIYLGRANATIVDSEISNNINWCLKVEYADEVVISRTIINDNVHGIYAFQAQFLSLTNVTMYHNDCNIFILDNCEVNILNSILWCRDERTDNNIAIAIANNGVSMSVNYSDIINGHNGISFPHDANFNLIEYVENIDADPLFVDPENGDFHLTEDSPCIDTGDLESDPDPDGTRADMGAFYFHQRDIEVDPDTLEFVGVQTGTKDTLVVMIQNVGLTPLQISAQAIEPEEAPFYIATGGGEVEIEPESDHLTWITFSPEEQAEYRAVLRIESDDPDEEIVEILLIGTALSVDDEDNQPLEFGISGVYPNPFNSRTTIHYEVPQPSQVSLSVYDLAGRLVERLVDDRVDAGRYTKTWQAGALPSGLYFIRFEAGDRAQMQKVVLIR